MTTLASAVSIGDNQLLIDTPLAAGQVPGWVKIDSEMLNVGGQHFRTGTTLVLSEPAKATHSQGATVTYAGNPFDPTFVAATAGGGAAEAGTVVVTDPPDDIEDALTGAASPSADAPFVTIVVTGTRLVFADIDGTTTVIGAFLDSDVGWLISGFGIPDGATVVSVNEGAGTAVISAAATETASVSTRVTEPDPGAIGSGGLWLRLEAAPNHNSSLSMRSQNDDGWIALGPSFYDENGWLAGQVIQQSGGTISVIGYPRNLAVDLMQVSMVPGYGLVIDGASSLIHFENLPTVDPGSGGLWLNGTTLSIGT